MDRRRYLAATGVAVAGLAAGCVGNADSPDRGDDTDQGTPMMTYEARNDKTDDGRPLEHTVNVLYGGLRDERRPLRLELSSRTRVTRESLTGNDGVRWASMPVRTDLFYSGRAASSTASGTAGGRKLR